MCSTQGVESIVWADWWSRTVVYVWSLCCNVESVDAQVSHRVTLLLMSHVRSKTSCNVCVRSGRKLPKPGERSRVGTSGGALLRIVLVLSQIIQIKVVASVVEAGGHANHISEFLKLNGAALHNIVFHLQYNNTGCIFLAVTFFCIVKFTWTLASRFQEMARRLQDAEDRHQKLQMEKEALPPLWPFQCRWCSYSHPAKGWDEWIYT